MNRQLFHTLMNTSVGQHVKTASDAVMQKTFTNDLACKTCRLYDWSGNFLQDVDAKFLEPKEYSILKDQIEYQIEFRPNFFPEVVYSSLNTLGEKRMGFYIDIPDATGVYERWLIWNRNDKKQFVKYFIVKTNWTFNWTIDGVLYSCRGIVRDQNSYNSGVWSDDMTSSVDDQAKIIMPMNDITATIDYDTRFLLTTNHIHPLSYSVTKRNDIFPVGIIKLTLAQDRVNNATDDTENMVCGRVDTDINVTDDCVISGYNTLRSGGSARTFNAVFYTDGQVDTSIVGEWSHDIPTSLLSNFTIDITAQNTLVLSCAKNTRLSGTKITLTCANGEKVGTYVLEVIA